MTSVIAEVVAWCVGILLFLGWCHYCHGLPKQYLKCKACGATKSETGYQPLSPDDEHEHSMIVDCLRYRCDGLGEECQKGYMELVVRKWTWWLTRPFAFVWAPLPLTLNAILTIVKR